MTTDLSMPLHDVFADRALLNRVVSAVMLDQGLTFMAALDRLHEQAETGGTLRNALAWVANPETVEPTLRMLERRDQAVEATYQRSLPSDTLKRDAMGRILCSQPGDAGTDVGSAIADPSERENRFQRAKRFDAKYEAANGRQLFDRDDKLALGGGVDIVKTLEVPAGQAERAARSAADEVARELDQAIATAGRKRYELRLLDAKLSRLEGPGAEAARETARRELEQQALDALEPTTKLLDRLENGGVVETTTRNERVRWMLDHADLAAEITREVRERMRLLDRSEHHFAITLEEVMRGEPMPTVTPEPEVPAGVRPGSHDVDRRVRMLMAEQDEPDYTRALERVMRGEA